MSGFLMAAYHSLFIAAAEAVGTSVSTALCMSTAIVGSCVLGAVVLDDGVRSSTMCGVALMLMVLGTFGSCWCKEVAHYMKSAEERSPILQSLEMESKWSSASGAARVFGVLVSICAGTTGSALLLPAQLGRVELAHFWPAFGLGAFAVTAAVTLASAAMTRSVSHLRLPTEVVAGAILAGLLWMAGCALCLIAARHVGFGFSQSVFSCQMVVTVFWNAQGSASLRGFAQRLVMAGAGLVCAGTILLSAVVHA
mmetsp:Transcript_64789/g.173648  ORF Transcript_64789/g.173648 Transcript_64789/m.173648 type:complete len:253 (+) Transcript_64789:3376-4134(+)